jgi:hypothetical protein
MKYTKEQLMPVRLTEEVKKTLIEGEKYWEYSVGFLSSPIWDGDGFYGYSDRYIKWIILIPGAPEEVKPLAYPANIPQKRGKYIVHRKTSDKWEIFGWGLWEPANPDPIDYFIPVRLEDLEKEDDTEETVVSVNMKNGKPTISNISAKKFHVEQLEKMGFDVQLIKREPEIAPCPNPECGAECTVILAAVPRFDDGTTDDYRYDHCPRCKYYGPRGNGRIEAIRLHNLICERK